MPRGCCSCPDGGGRRPLYQNRTGDPQARSLRTSRFFCVQVSARLRTAASSGAAAVSGDGSGAGTSSAPGASLASRAACALDLQFPDLGLDGPLAQPGGHVLVGLLDAQLVGQMVDQFLLFQADDALNVRADVPSSFPAGRRRGFSAVRDNPCFPPVLRVLTSVLQILHNRIFLMHGNFSATFSGP